MSIVEDRNNFLRATRDIDTKIKEKNTHPCKINNLHFAHNLKIVRTKENYQITHAYSSVYSTTTKDVKRYHSYVEIIECNLATCIATKCEFLYN